MTPIYLDHAAATPMRPEVRSAMRPFLEGVAGNPSSVHRWGRRARRALERARAQVAELLGVAANEVHFVRGGTESVNLAVFGRVDHVRRQAGVAPSSKGVLVRSALEHSSVREAMASLEAEGWAVQVLAVAPDGSIELPPAESVRSNEIALVSVQWVNHETGTVLPVREVAEWAASLGVPLHVDAIQAIGLPRTRFDTLPIAMASVSGHKLGGPRGTGVLMVREGTEIRPRLYGGGQEAGLRPGTEDVAGAVGLARALEIVVEGREDEARRLRSLRDRLEAGLRERIPGLRMNGAEGPRAPHILNIGVRGIPRDVLPGALDLEGIGVSAGSACRSGSTTVSPVLLALYGEEAARIAPLRLSLGWTTTAGEIDDAIRTIPPVVERAASLGVGA